ncbi:glycosyl transferase, group 1 [Psychromonas ingrahamii 37]|uniref:Glycosyl transferase, group 1 n=1 Tax=Psychromonas ingrahamii (strain DSM 17664 / CCUG 51855 / 37) TaxID=357804 RepID=A1SS47_PSYIN|nr:glycosyltransferase family 4 protein [Psychromonas ingrahamii]ABM02312.1 glycosyl transferase, group 1 [Psychromonas ingrahamii 37]
MQKKINIVHYWGGCPNVATSKELSFLMLIKKCAEHGWNNWLVLSKYPENSELIDPILQTGCEIIYQPRSKGNFDPASIYCNFKLLWGIKCHVFHCYNDHTSPIIAAMFARVPIRVWSKLAMSSYYEQGITPKGLQRLMPSTWITCLFSNRILAISDAAGKEIYEQVGFKNKVATVQVPVSLERFMTITGAGIRDEFNLQQSDIVITAVGHFIEVKGWDIAIKAFARVYKEIPNAKLLLVGKKTSVEFYQKICLQIERYDLQKHVFFAGNRSDIPEILKASNIFILPSRSEGTPAALIEAMAAGLPCIAAETGGIPEVIVHGNNGLMFRREDAEDLADKIVCLLSDSELRLQLTKMAQKNLEKFSIENYVDSVFSHYQNLLKYYD